MSKGGAGKVYFVLYLAVILELLIIIVERDEAEEHLMKKQQESMRIVESILTQLQSGAGTEGINTRPQDAIVISDNLPDDQKKLFKKFRTYFIEVGVTDVTTATNMEGMDEAQKKEKIETLKKLANVQELQYEVYYHPSKEVEVPDSPPASEFKKAEKEPQAGMKLANSPNATSNEMWELKATRKLVLDTKSMPDYQKPIYNESDTKTGDINQYAPDDSARVNRIFGYSQDKTDKLRQNGKLTKRAFVCNFEPPTEPGWYKLRFSSQTNRIMGISSDQKFNALKDDQKVNIGTVQLKVKDLKSVQRQLAEQLAGSGIPSFDAFANGSMKVEEFNTSLEAAKVKVSKETNSENSSQKASRIDLYGYIAKLLSPGQYTSFDQNRGSIEIDIYVQKPEIEQLFPDVRWVHQAYNSFDEADSAIAIMSSNLYDKTNLKPTVTIDGRAIDPSSIVKVDPSGKAKDGEWRVVIKGRLPEKTYKLTAKFSAGTSKSIVDSASVDLRVFKTGLFVGREASESTGEGNLEGNNSDEQGQVNYSDDLINTLTMVRKFSTLSYSTKPSSGNQIPNSEFETHVILNDKSPIIKKGNYNILAKEGIYIEPDVNSVGLKIFWVNPHSQDMRVCLFPPGDNKDVSYPVKKPVAGFESASVNFDASSNPNDPKFTFSVRVKPTPAEKSTIVSATVTPSSSGGITGGTGKGKYQLKPSGRYELVKETDGAFKLTQKFILVGKKPVPKGTSFKVEVTASAIQKIILTDETCDPGTKTFRANIKY